jgi:hypothetical protein
MSFWGQRNSIFRSSDLINDMYPGMLKQSRSEGVLGGGGLTY